MPVFQALLDILYPPRCAACGARGVRLCADCTARCIPLPAAKRPRALPTSAALRRAIGIYPFEDVVREAIHAFKYRGERGLAGPLAALLAPHRLCADAILVPVPLHRDRLRERGFNQAEALARELGRRWTLPVATELRRQRPTDRQVGQNAEARLHNVRDAFAWHGPAPKRPILLIDDVLTTGATLLACAEALRQAGAAEIEALTVARA